MSGNYDQYGDFSQNFDVMGSTGYVYNEELADKTSVYFLRNMTGPNWSVKQPNLQDKITLKDQKSQ